MTGTQVAWLEPGKVTLLDLITGIQTTILSSSQIDVPPVAAWDWTSDGLTFAYGQVTPDGRSLVFHLVAGGSDRVLSTVSVPSPDLGFDRIEFSPDGQYIAIGSPTSVTSGDSAAVQVRRLDGSLVFSSGGTGQQTWAGVPAKLYFQGPSGVETWDPTHGVSRLPIVQWQFPVRSAGGRWLAYQVPATYWAELRIIDTRSGAGRAIGRASEGVAWVTPTLLRFDEIAGCPSPLPAVLGNPCTSRPVVYDTFDGSKTVTVPAYVFDAWPKGTPPWP